MDGLLNHGWRRNWRVSRLQKAIDRFSGNVPGFRRSNAARAGELAPGTRIDAAFCLEHDSYNGGWSAILKDFRAIGTEVGCHRREIG